MKKAIKILTLWLTFIMLLNSLLACGKTIIDDSLASESGSDAILGNAPSTNHNNSSNNGSNATDKNDGNYNNSNGNNNSSNNDNIVDEEMTEEEKLAAQKKKEENDKLLAALMPKYETLPINTESNTVKSPKWICWGT